LLDIARRDDVSTDETIRKAVEVFGPEFTLTLVKAHERNPRTSLLRDIANGDIEVVFKQRHDNRHPDTGRWRPASDPREVRAPGSSITWRVQDTRGSLAQKVLGALRKSD
jgi:hypothetical protein